MTELDRALGNLRRVSHKELRDLVLCYYPAKKSLMCWGTIGIGKSQEIVETAKYLADTFKLDFQKDIVDPKKFCLMDIRLSTIDATDVRGVPFPNKKDNPDSAKWLLPDWLPRDPKSRGILFLDEINLAPPSIQASAYSLIRDRKIGSYILPEGWICVSAGNRIEDVQNVFEMSPALENRLGHCELLPPTAQAWAEWANNNGINKYIIAFILWNPNKLMMFNPEDEKNRMELKEKAFATPRTWEDASILLTKNDVPITEYDRVELLVATSVGQGNAMEFVSFLKVRQQIDFKDIIRNPEKAKEFNDERPDLAFTLVTVLSDWYKQNSEKQHLQRICQVAENLRAEFAILLLRFCKREHEQKFKNMVKNIPEWKNTLSPQYGEYVIG